jgi:hypothetical protein
MRLICDDYQQVYVWVEDHDENIELSPHFDYEEDAIQWLERMKEKIHGLQ